MTRLLVSAVNMFTSSPKISHLTNREVFQLNLSKIDEKDDQNAAMQISEVSGAH